MEKKKKSNLKKGNKKEKGVTLFWLEDGTETRMRGEVCSSAFFNSSNSTTPNPHV